MKFNENTIIQILSELIHLKKEINSHIVGMAWKLPTIDSAIDLIVSQQTEIMSLKYQLEIEKSENKEFHDLFEYSPDSFNEEEIKSIKEFCKNIIEEETNDSKGST